MQADELQKTQAQSQHQPFLITAKPSSTLINDQQENEQPPSDLGGATQRRRKKAKRRKKQDEFAASSFDIPGVTKITISPVVQKIIQCSVGEQVTAERPWKYVAKEILEGNLDFREGSSEFLPIKDELLKYPREELLLGYIPDESLEKDTFYICLTELAEIAVNEIIDQVKKDQEERVFNAIIKTAKPWKTQGSESELELMQFKQNRPLIAVEIESKYPILSGKCTFKFRMVENAQDGYSGFVDKRKYSTTRMKRIDASTQVSPFMTSNEAQTIYSYPANNWTQYEYDYKSLQTFDKDLLDNVDNFIINEESNILDMMRVNSGINFYTNDYFVLKKTEEVIYVSEKPNIRLYSKFSNHEYCKERYITSVSWHYMWTNIVAISYAKCSLSIQRQNVSDRDEVIEIIYNTAPVLLWSFENILQPKLRLVAPREVSVLSFCPYDENILVGGCSNGQIVIWDIKNKFAEIEKEIKLTERNKKYRKRMYSHMKWSKNSNSVKTLRHAVLSRLEHSHAGTVTSIKWFSPFEEILKNGQITDTSEDDNKKRLLFMTGSQDGTILFWKLSITPLSSTSDYSFPRESKRLKRYPSALIENISLFSVLNNVFKPIFKLNAINTCTDQFFSISTLNSSSTVSRYMQINPDVNFVFDITNRIVCKPIFEKPTHLLNKQLILGTLEGDVAIVEWEKVESDDGEDANTQNITIQTFTKFHDGPVTAVAESKIFPGLFLTTGGCSFALWISSFKQGPILWRKGECRYTHVAWNDHCHPMFYLSRSDGNLEIWDLRSRSDKFIIIKKISAQSLTGIYPHGIAMKQNVLGVADAQGALTLFLIARSITVSTDQDDKSVYKFCEREAQRKLKLKQWQDKWIKLNAETVKASIKTSRPLHKTREKQFTNLELHTRKKTKRVTPIASTAARFTQKNRQELLVKEKERLTKILLRKKELDISILEEQRLPLTEAASAENKKKDKQKQSLNNADRQFDKTVALLFSDAIEKKPPPSPDPYSSESALSTKEHIFQAYKDESEICQSYINTHPYIYSCDWFKVIKAGKERRKILDGFYNRRNHSSRLQRGRQDFHKYKDIT